MTLSSTPQLTTLTAAPAIVEISSDPAFAGLGFDEVPFGLGSFGGDPPFLAAPITIMNTISSNPAL